VISRLQDAPNSSCVAAPELPELANRRNDACTIVIQSFEGDISLKAKSMKRYLSTFPLLIVLCFGLLAWGKDMPLTADPSIPAATGKVSWDKDDNSNLKVKVEVKHLAQPTTLTPARQTYVVWIQPRGKDAENQGQIRVNNDLNGEFQTRTAYRAFDIFVTAEDNPTASVPSGPQLLKATVQQ
jgi:hypothetical protein